MTNRERADEFKERVTDPIYGAKEYCHASAVIRRSKVAGWLERLLEAALRIAYDYQGMIARGER